MRQLSCCVVLQAAAFVALVGLAGAFPHPGFDEFEFRHQARIQDQEARVQEEEEGGYAHEEGGYAHNEEYVKQKELSSAQVAAYFKYGGYNLAAKEEAEIQDGKDSLPADFDEEIAEEEDDENPEEESPGKDDTYDEGFPDTDSTDTGDNPVKMESPGEDYPEEESPGEDYPEEESPGEATHDEYDAYEDGFPDPDYDNTDAGDNRDAVKMDGPVDGNEGDYLPAELVDDDGFIQDFESSQEATEGEIPSHQANSAKPSIQQDNVLRLLVVDRDQTEEKAPELTILIEQPAPTIQAINSERKEGNPSHRGTKRHREDGRGGQGAAKASDQEDGLNVGNRDPNTGAAPDGKHGFGSLLELVRNIQSGGAGGPNNKNQHSQQDRAQNSNDETVDGEFLQGLVILQPGSSSDALYYTGSNGGGGRSPGYAYNGGDIYTPSSGGQYGRLGPIGYNGYGGQYGGGGGGGVKTYRLPVRYIYIYTSQFKQRDL